MSSQLATEFKEYVRTSSLLYSYKLVLIRALLPLVSANGLAEVNSVAEAFRDYYLSRLDAGLPADRQGATINKAASMSLNAIRALILDNPFSAYSRVGWLRRDGSQIGFAQNLWDQLTLADREDLWQLADKRLEQYYQSKVERPSLRPLLAEVMDSYLEARKQRFSGSVPVVGVLTRDIPAALTASELAPSAMYKLVGSAGQGNWASVPWVAILDRQITESIQSGIYAVYLFSSDMTAGYLALMLGVTDIVGQNAGKAALDLLRTRAASERARLDMNGFESDQAALGEERLAKQYAAGMIAYLKYERETLPEDDQLLADLDRMLSLYKQLLKPADETMTVTGVPTLSANQIIDHIHRFITVRGFQYSRQDMANFYLTLRTKPFTILAGVSGTGKSLLPKLLADAVSGERRIISVRPDWNDGSDLLGYLDLEGRFRPGELTGIIEECGTNPNVPFFVVLDEMNLARVEHYMSDLLSIMETRYLEDDTIKTEPLLKGSHFRVAEDRERYGGITLPDNLYLVGTVNMDETTHPFSKKVLDRANTIEFSHVNLKGYAASSDDLPEPIILKNDQLRGKMIHLSDALAQDPVFVDAVVDELVVINHILSQANLHVGYRVRDEIVIYMLHNRLLDLLEESVAFDYQLLQKILPRIQGSSQQVRGVLVDLLSFCGGVNLRSVNDDTLARLQEYEAGDVKGPYPRSATKLATMLRRYEEDGFTSYWV